MRLPSIVYLTAPKPPGYYQNSVELKNVPRIQDLPRKYTYILRCDDPSLAIFKRIFMLGLKVIVYVENLDHFFYKFRDFRGTRFVMLSDEPEPVDRIATYLEVESRIAGERKCVHPASQKSGFKGAKDFLHRRQEDIRGVEVSFFPRVFDSIHTSLAHPQEYLHTDSDMSSQIYRELLNGKKSMSQLQKKLGENIDQEVKSLLFTSVICLADGYFRIMHP